MIDAGSSTNIPLSNGAGELHVTEFVLADRVSFLDYIMGGCEINVHVAIDFTMSNGEPSESNSLHYLNPHTNTNQYTEAINAVMSILENYDSDRMFPVYGFGGKPPQAQEVSHCFALNGDIFAPECNGVKGIMRAYYESIKKVQLWGGTEFSSVLNYVNGYAEQSSAEITQFNQKYCICIIMTDGIIGDMPKTIDEIVRASALPMSIIIIGVGNANFDQMEELDGDVNPLFSKKVRKYSARDIV